MNKSSLINTFSTCTLVYVVNWSLLCHCSGSHGWFWSTRHLKQPLRWCQETLATGLRPYIFFMNINHVHVFGVSLYSLLLCLDLALPEGSCKYFWDDRPHHSTKSHWKCHQGEFIFISYSKGGFIIIIFPALTCVHLSLHFAPASWGAGRQWRWRPWWSIWLHHPAQPYRKKGNPTGANLPYALVGFWRSPIICTWMKLTNCMSFSCLQDVQCVEELKELILDQCEKCSTPSMTEELEQIFNDADKPVGLLLTERFINVPPQIALPLHKQLLWVALSL